MNSLQEIIKEVMDKYFQMLQRTGFVKPLDEEDLRGLQMNEDLLFGEIVKEYRRV